MTGEHKEFLQAPPDAEDLGNLMSNFDGEIDEEIAEQLKSGGKAGYPAWDFHGTVWWADGKYHCQIMQYRAHIDTVSAETPQTLMEECCARYGAS